MDDKMLPQSAQGTSHASPHHSDPEEHVLTEPSQRLQEFASSPTEPDTHQRGRSSRRRKLLWSIPGVLLAFAVIWLGFAAGLGTWPFPSHPVTPTPLPHSSIIKIGVDLPLTGGNASTGLPIAGGIQYALHQANSSHLIAGYTFETYQTPSQPSNQQGLDDQANATTGATNVQEAIGDALTAAIIGPYNSAVAKQEIPITNTTPIVQISPSNTNPCLTKDTLSDCQGDNNLLPTVRATGMTTYFRLATTDDLVVKKLVPFLRAKSYRTAYIIYNNDDLYSKFYAQFFRDEWTNEGGTLVDPIDNESPNNTILQYQSQLQLLSKTPDIVFYAGTMPAAAYVKEAMDNLPQFNTTAYAGAVVLDKFAQAVGSVGGPVYGMAPVGTTPATDSFRTQYISSQYATQDGYIPYTASAYDCTQIVMQAIKMVIEQDHILPPRGSGDAQGAKTFRQAIIKKMLHITASDITVPLTTTFQSFDQNGDTTNSDISIYSLSGNSSVPWQLAQ